MIDDIAKVLCKASNANDDCPTCAKGGKCSPEMWQAFRKEASAVLEFMSRRSLLGRIN